VLPATARFSARKRKQAQAATLGVDLTG
jgi:hypothetical protein